VILLSRFFRGGLPDRIQPAITFYFGLLAMAVGLGGIAMAPPPMAAIGMTALLGFGFSFPWSAVASVVLKRTPPGARGSAVSVLSAFYDLFVGTSSFAAGAIASHFGYPAAFWMAAIALSASAVAGWYVFRREEEPEVTEMESIDGADLVTEGIDVG
jgi:predicted MFS family arabinose efflux permease